MDLKIIIEIVVIIVGIIGGWFTIKNKVGNLEDKYKDQKDDDTKMHENLWKIIGDIRASLLAHEKESNQVRLDIERELGRIRENASKFESKLDSIISMMEKISLKMDKLEGGIR